MGDIIQAKLSASEEVVNNRTVYSSLAKAQAELGELAEEIRIKQGDSYKEAGEDGILGEAVDTISPIIDILYLDNPDITAEEIETAFMKKLQKWKEKEKEFLTCSKMKDIRDKDNEQKHHTTYR